MNEDTLLQELARLVEDMAFDYDRLSVSGQETYDRLCSVVNLLIQG